MAEPHPRLDAYARALGATIPVPEACASPFVFHQLRDALASVDLDALTPRSRRGASWQAILRSLVGAPPVVGAGEPPADPPALGELEDALDVHQALEVRLVEHRLALMAADLDRAAAALAAFDRVMRHHLAVEEALVGPRYVAAAPVEGWPRGSDPRILDNEHAKIRARLDDFATWVESLRQAELDDARRRVACLELLDREKVFHDLLEHHDLRERTLVYPHLAAVTDPATQEEIVQRLLDPDPWRSLSA